MTQPSTTFSALLSHVAHFLTVAIHVILFERRLYPPASFITARAYDLPVKQNRHPGVCSWVQSAVSALREQLATGSVARIAVAIAHPESCDILERFVFDVHKLPVVSKDEWETLIEHDDGSSKASNPQLEGDPRAPGGTLEHELVDLTEQFRAALTALSTCSKRLGNVPKGCTYTVAVELKDEADPPIGHPQPWIPAQPKSQRLKGIGAQPETVRNADEEGLYDVPDKPDHQPEQQKDLRSKRSIPLRTVDADKIQMEVWAEEGIAKAHLTEQDFAESAESSMQSAG